MVALKRVKEGFSAERKSIDIVDQESATVFSQNRRSTSQIFLDTHRECVI